MNTSLVTHQAYTPATVNPVNEFLTGHLSPSTKRAYQTDIKKFLDHNSLTMDELLAMNPGQIYKAVISYRDSISKIKDGTSYIVNASTVARKLTALKVYFEFLVKLGYYAVNPIQDVKSPAIPTESTSEGLTVSELKSIFSHIDSDIIIGKRDKAILSLMFHLALRRSEVAKLKVSDIKANGEFTVVQFIGKRNKRREIPLKPEVVQVIREYLTATGRDIQSAGFLFQSHSNRNNNSDGISPEAVFYMVRRYISLAGIDKRISPHSFRHSAVTIALDSGSSYREVMNLTGHSDTRLVMRYDRGDKLKNNATWKLPSIN